MEERIYLGGVEIFRRYISGALDFERETLRIMDDRKAIAHLETKTIENGREITPTTNLRYQYDNHLGSACLELDQNAAIISYEEYHPFGTTSYRSGRTETEVSLKRYKYVGKERDEETGLYYYGARYYAGWLGRFVSVDAFAAAFPNTSPFVYANNNPIKNSDPSGNQTENEVDNVHTVTKGETLSGIAKKYDTTVEDIYKNNPNLPSDPSKLQIGTQIKLESDDADFKIPFQIHEAAVDNTYMDQYHGNIIIPDSNEVDADDVYEFFGGTSPVIDKLLTHALKSEGGYSDRSSDKGGKTKYGIAEKREWKRAAEFLGISNDTSNIKNLTEDQAKKYYIYTRLEPYRINDISNEKIANALFDQSIITPGLINKNVKNALRNLGVDINVNRNTLTDSEVEELNKSNPDKFVKEFVKLQNRYYKSLNDTIHEAGWLKRTKRLINYK